MSPTPANKKLQETKTKRTSTPLATRKKSQTPITGSKQKMSASNSVTSTEQVSGQSSNTTGSNVSSPTNSKCKTKEGQSEGGGVMQRSATFLKDKPSVLLIEQQ